ncbi:myoneurin-like [Gigantopelta aegis]|uniref:myoneurin-like n=1 Tax=Gigantopelta aegis TaxID=1735272 RepID=UPI001B88B9B4|nr:myoneurin-like [Gigantopelta aegis]
MTATERIVLNDMSAPLEGHLDAVPLLYLCCRKCAGLFTSEETFSVHAPCCVGDPYLCNTEYFACHREKFFSFYLDLWKTLKQNSDYLHKDNANNNEETCCSSENRELVQSSSYDRLTVSRIPATKSVPVSLNRGTQNNELEISKCINKTMIVAGRDKSNFHNDVALRTLDAVPLHSTVAKNEREDTVNNNSEMFSQTKKHSCSTGSCQICSNTVVAASQNEEASFYEDAVETMNCNNNKNNHLEISVKNTPLPVGDDTDISNNNNCPSEVSDENFLQDEEIIYTMQHDNRSKQGKFHQGHEEASPREMAEQCSKLSVDGCDVYSCNLCGYKTKHAGFMHRHLSAHNSGEVFRCDFCEFFCYLKSRLLIHMQCHREEMLVCDVCSATFRHRSTMKRHIDIKHKGESRHICNTCGYLATSNSGLMDHIRTHTGHLLQCDVDGCSFQTAYKRSLVLHREKHQGIQRYVCDVCGYRTSESGSLQKHLSIHKGKKLFKCPHCSYRAVAHHDVVKHARAKHLRQKKYCCNKCNFSTGYPSSLTNHLMAHAGIKPYKCSLCSYQSNMAAKVTRHMHQRHPAEQCEVIKLNIPFEYNVKDFVTKTNSSSFEVQVIKLSEEDIVEKEEEKSPHPDPIADPDSNPIPNPNPEGDYLHNTSYQMSSFKPCSEEEISISVHENDSNNLLDEGDADGNIFNHSDSAVFGSSAYKLLSQSTDDIRSDCMQRWELKPYYRHGVYRRSSSVCSEPMLSSYRALSDADPDSCSMDATDEDVKDAVETGHLIGESDEVMHETRHLICVSHEHETDHLIGGSTVLTTYQCNSCLQLLTTDTSVTQHQLICTGT